MNANVDTDILPIMEWMSDLFVVLEDENLKREAETAYKGSQSTNVKTLLGRVSVQKKFFYAYWHEGMRDLTNVNEISKDKAKKVLILLIETIKFLQAVDPHTSPTYTEALQVALVAAENILKFLDP